jgi:hypothetical protein
MMRQQARVPKYRKRRFLDRRGRRVGLLEGFADNLDTFRLSSAAGSSRPAIWDSVLGGMS